MKEIYPAHIRVAENGIHEIQTCQEHCIHTAAYAEQALEEAGLGKTGYMAGLLHDMGKFHPDFATYISASALGEKMKKGSVIHTFSGVKYLLEHFEDDPMEQLTAELLAYAVGAHHGLFDCVNEKHEDGFAHRREKDAEHSLEAAKNFLDACKSSKELELSFQNAAKEIDLVYDKLCNLTESDEELLFYLSLLARLLLSSVIEGDRRDTAEFMEQNENPDIRGSAVIWSECLERVEEKLSHFSADTPINRMRQKISLQCRDFAEKPGGIYRLNVPTGSGKTLSCLRYALAHAKQNHKSRLIFTAPLLSILDQNAAVIRKYIDDDRLILEHHSNLVREQKGEQEDTREKLLTESWHAPVIITTLVQLLNTLYDGRTSAIRRYQALCNSVIVIDEVQTVPKKLLTLFNLAVNFLAEVCHATVILCSATQPVLEETEHPVLASAEPMVPYDREMWKIFARTRIICTEQMNLEEIAAFTAVKAIESGSVLTVCNTKSEAAFLYNCLSEKNTSCFHLSASMCMAHRKQSLSEMADCLNRIRLGSPEKMICISTQVIEAGVDISFGCVIRLAAGMDNVVQAAGRCNRNGESSEPLPVYLVPCQNENLGRLQDILAAKQTTENLIEQVKKDPEKFANDLASDKAISSYYRLLYRSMACGEQDGMVKKGISLFDLLSENTAYTAGKEYNLCLRQAFQTAGREFQVFDTETYDLLVPYQEGKELISQLCGERAKYDIHYAKILLQKARPYTISIYQFQKQKLESEGGIYPVLDGKVLALQEGYYHLTTGLQMSQEGQECSTLIW